MRIIREIAGEIKSITEAPPDMLRARFTFLFLCAVLTTKAQDKPEKKMYFVLKAGPSFLFTAAKKGMEQFSFPYSVRPVGSGSSDSSFVSNPFAPLKVMQTAINFTLEIGNKNQFFEVNFGGFTSSDDGSFIAFGYGRNFYIDLFGKHVEAMQRDFVFKPSLHITYNAFNKAMGTLDNLNKGISIGSYTSGPTFTESDAEIDDFTSTTTTYSTQTLAIAYLHRSWTLTPQVTFGNNQYKHIFHWEIVAGGYFSVAEAIGVKFTQEATDGKTHQSSSMYAIGTNAVSAEFNGNSTTKSPVRFTGFKIGFNIGISTGPPGKHKVQNTKNK